MADDPCGESTKQFITRAQKSTNQLKALLAKLLPSTGGVRPQAECSASAVDALLSDITNLLSQALAASQGQGLPGQGFKNHGGCGGGRRPEPRRSGQQARMDSVCRMIIPHSEHRDSYSWKKYGQKDIFGARFSKELIQVWPQVRLPGEEAGAVIRHRPVEAGGHLHRNTYLRRPTAVFITLCCAGPGHELHAQWNIGHNLPIAADPPALLKAGYPVEEETVGTLSMEDQEQDTLLFIPSPVCSQSELLPVEVPKQAPDDPLLFMLTYDDEDDTTSDYV